jgi:hypothetical protein
VKTRCREKKEGAGGVFIPRSDPVEENCSIIMNGLLGVLRVETSGSWADITLFERQCIVFKYFE